jgi:hypothetical protein
LYVGSCCGDSLKRGVLRRVRPSGREARNV